MVSEDEHLIVSHILCSGFRLERRDDVQHVETVCALCGEALSRAVPLKSLLKPTASDLADTFRYQQRRAYTCEHCAACYAEPRLLTGSLFATCEYGIKPTVSTQPKRVRWLDLLGVLHVNTECVAIMTSNTKRRLWPGAVVSRYGPTWQLLFVHEDTERLLSVDVAALHDCLALVMEVYNIAKISKAAIATTLLHTLSTGQGHAQLLDYERRLRQWRGSDEFLVSLFVAQKEEPDDNIPNHP